MATAAKLCNSGQLLMENRNSSIVDAELTAAIGSAERDSAIQMLTRLTASRRRRTVAGDKGYDTCDFVAGTRVSGSLRTSRRTPRTEDPRSMVEPPDTPATPCRSEYGNGSKNRSDGSRPSAEDAKSATSADNETGPGSRSKRPSTTSSESPPSTPPPPDRRRSSGETGFRRTSENGTRKKPTGHPNAPATAKAFRTRFSTLC